MVLTLGCVACRPTVTLRYKPRETAVVRTMYARWCGRREPRGTRLPDFRTEVEDPGKLALEVDAQHSVLRGQHDLVDQGADLPPAPPPQTIHVQRASNHIVRGLAKRERGGLT